MIARSDAIVVLPGGTGTLDELFDVLATTMLGLLEKPIVMMNTAGFFDTLLRFLDELHTKGFLTKPAHEYLVVVSSTKDVLRALNLDDLTNSTD